MQQDIAIIGGGIIGVASAVELARRGAQVTVLERDRIGHGCSYGNAGWLTPSQAVPLANPAMLLKSFKWMLDPDSPLYIQPRPDPAFVRWLIEFLLASKKAKFERGAAALVELCRVSVDMWEEVAKRSPEPFGFERHGLLAVYENAASLEAARRGVDLVCQSGVRAERWTTDEVRTKEPAIIGPQVGGYFYPDDAHCEPYLAVKALEAEARALGVRFVEGAEVYRISDGAGSRRLTTTRGEITAGQIVIATGPWSEGLGKMLGFRLPVIGAKGYSIVLPPANPQPKRSIYLIERKIAVNPHRDALRIAGTLELVRNDFSISARRVDVIVRGAKGMLNIGETPASSEIWRGLRPCTPDGMPVIGRARGRGDVWLATGHQMAGLKTAPGTGLLLAQLMAGETPRFDPEPFRADRY
ncbi:MAG: FAD-dependent oxidoreductase [Acidobacteriota bacterium]|nr:FAD-dependent oxidoreductase [Acidobacteriota bacterium]